MKTTLRLLAFLKPYSGWVALSVFLGVATIASNIGLLGTSAYLIARAALHPSIAELEVAIVGVRFFGIGRGVFRYLERLISHSVNFHLLGQLRVWFYTRLEPLAPAALRDIHSGDLLARSVADIETLQDFYVRVVSPPITALVVTLGMCLFVGQYHSGLAVVLLSGLLISGLGIPLLAGLVSRAPARALVVRRAEMSQAFVDTIQGMPDLLVFDQAANTHQAFRFLNTQMGKAQRSLSWSGAVIGGINLLAVNLTLFGILILAIPLVTQSDIDGVILAVLALVTLASFEAVNPLGQAAQQLQTSLQAAGRLFELSGRQPAVSEPALPSAEPQQPLDISIRDLTFCYASGLSPVLLNINLDLPEGKRIGIVGPSGAGKTTLLQLFLRFWDYDTGQILMAGKDLKNYASSDVRQRIGVISQDTYVFTATLRENLLLARPGAEDSALFQALDRVQLQPWFQTLPHGLDTWMGEHGCQMSGGERQRLAMAQAFLKEANLYLLDEPTNGLDAETENSLTAMLEELTRGKSVLWVTHSFKGMTLMDEILVLRDGRIVERGSHAALVASQGEYARITGTFEDRLAS